MKQLFTLLVVLALLVPGEASAQERLRVGMLDLLEQGGGAEAKSVVGEAYRRLGMAVVFVCLPSKRELECAAQGVTDASLVRTAAVSAEYPGLVRVPFPLFRYTLVAAYAREDLDVRGPSDLVALRVGVDRGSVGTMQFCRRNNISVCALKDLGQGMRMLREGRLDAVLEEQVLLEMAAKKAAVPLKCSLPLQRGYYYHWLNREHAGLAPRLACSLKSMYEDGTTARLLGGFSEMLKGLEVRDESLAGACGSGSEI
ncbi:substrate-binding periplasmic protein [Pseudodesulfovibrio indicus]|uniref:Extracellular solute-binding protein (Family 3) n=1 Tax=Pseudodesulfovibrio indicus TaxID=1716143 RepID=A0A140D938_9BACT|nr:transporter substrate-binding domain-containing protein [Pseudodesulfovibrio indicus]AMK09705.1 hypothetical protein AWY79_00575 [Pseudodesulfovibrio indicus]TDT86338.1 extracellular solute-binding protein (family 3) [Pseudodesulfovibrio indicus]